MMISQATVSAGVVVNRVARLGVGSIIRMRGVGSAGSSGSVF